MALVHPWSVDATTWSDSDFKSLKASGDLDIQDFCGGPGRQPRDWLARGSHCILVGRRGTGKSFLLAYRSHHHRNGDRDTFFHPSGGNPRPLVERLTLLSGALPRSHWLRSAESADSWSTIWQVSLLGLLAWRICDEPERLNQFGQIFRKIDHLNDIYFSGNSRAAQLEGESSDSKLASPLLQWFLGCVISAQPADRKRCQDSLDELLFCATSDWAVAIKRSIIRGKRSWKRIAIYLDNPDELFRPTDNDLWTNVQQGLVLAIWKMQKGGELKDDLNVYACVRSEAVSNRVHPDLQHALDQSLHLRYDEIMMEELFINQIALESPEELARPDIVVLTDPVKAFVGFDSISHQDRRGSDGMALTEPLVRALIRHTRLVPRELIVFGKQIHSMRTSARTESAIKKATNAEAKRNVDYIRENCFPPWAPKLERLLIGIDSEVLTRGQFESLIQKHDMSVNGISALEYLVSLGLVGYAEPDPTQHRICYLQRFAFDEPFGHTSAADLLRDYYFVHPALKEWIKGQPGRIKRWRTQPNTLIGDGLRYESEPAKFRLMVNGNQPTILLNGTTPLQGSDTTTSDPIRFLFLALWAWKLRGGKVWPTMHDLFRVRKSLTAASGKGMTFPFIGTDQHSSGSQVRTWAKKLNANSVLRTMSKQMGSKRTRKPSKAGALDGAILVASAHERHPDEQATRDGRRTGFITVSAPEDAGADARVAFQTVRADDICIDSNCYVDVTL